MTGPSIPRRYARPLLPTTTICASFDASTSVGTTPAYCRWVWMSGGFSPPSASTIRRACFRI